MDVSLADSHYLQGTLGRQVIRGSRIDKDMHTTYLHVQTDIPISMMKYDGMCTDFSPRSREAGRQEAKGSTGQPEETRSCVGVSTLALDI